MKKEDLKKLIKEVISEMGGYDVNDDAMIKLRASQIKKDQPFKKPLSPLKKNKLQDLLMKRKRVLAQMENDPEIELQGGPVADKYGEVLNQLDQKIAKIKGE